jgi:hypothetical protein
VVERDRVERHFEFFCNQHRNRRVHALAHLDLWNHQRDLACRVDLDERVRCEHAVLRRFVCVAADHRLAALLILTDGRQTEAEQQTAARRRADAHAELEERAARHAARFIGFGLRALRAFVCIEQSLGHVRLPSPRA